MAPTTMAHNDPNRVQIRTVYVQTHDLTISAMMELFDSLKDGNDDTLNAWAEFMVKHYDWPSARWYLKQRKQDAERDSGSRLEESDSSWSI